MRTITMCKVDEEGRLYGEVFEDGEFYTIEPFHIRYKDLEQALLDRLDILQVEKQFEAEMESGQ